jgi:hypothetical protein
MHLMPRVTEVEHLTNRVEEPKMLDEEDDLVDPLEVAEAREAISTEPAAAKEDCSASFATEAHLWEECIDGVFLDLVEL